MATLDPSIILQGQPVDVIGAMGRGNELAAQTNALRAQTDLRNLYRTQGANILAGDQGALNALAGFDPMAAMEVQKGQLGLQGQRLDMQATQQRMDMLSREEQRAVEAFKAEKGAAAAAAAAAQIEDSVRMGMAIPDAASWDAFMSQNAPELVGQFANRKALAAKYMTMAEALKMSEAPDPTKGAPTGYMFTDPRNPAAGVKPLPGYQAKPLAEVNVNNGGGKFDEEFAKTDAQALSEVSAAGISAMRNAGRIDQLGEILAASPSGWQAALAQRAGEWGVNTDGLDSLQAAQAMINSLVPEQRQPGSGPMSDTDLELFKQSLPRLINQPGGNQMIVATMRAIAQYDAEGARIVQWLRAGEINRQEAFDALQNRKNPLDGLKMPGPTEGGTLSDDDLLRMYGGK